MGYIVILFLIFLFIIIPLAVYCFLIYLPVRWAKKRGITKRKQVYIGVVSFIVVSSLFFGKNLVSYSAFKYYCKNEAGLTVYKTLDQWKAENPGVWETLRKVNDFRDYQDREKYPDVALEREFNGEIYGVNSGGNQRIILYDKTEYTFWGAIEIYRYIVYDIKSNIILSMYNDILWKNTWGTTRNKNGRRTGLVPTLLSCKKSQDYYNFLYSVNAFSNFNLIQGEQ